MQVLAFVVICGVDIEECWKKIAIAEMLLWIKIIFRSCRYAVAGVLASSCGNANADMKKKVALADLCMLT
jgi:hypothetical protein